MSISSRQSGGRRYWRQHRADSILDRHVPIGEMQAPQVGVVGDQPSQARVDLASGPMVTEWSAGLPIVTSASFRAWILGSCAPRA